jgi:hypothetical protein
VTRQLALESTSWREDIDGDGTDADVEVVDVENADREGESDAATADAVAVAVADVGESSCGAAESRKSRFILAGGGDMIGRGVVARRREQG